jgi:hypothetical protein
VIERAVDGFEEGAAIAPALAVVDPGALPGLVVVAALCALAVALARTVAGDRLSATTPIALGSYLALVFWLVWLLGSLILA